MKYWQCYICLKLITFELLVKEGIGKHWLNLRVLRFGCLNEGIDRVFKVSTYLYCTTMFMECLEIGHIHTETIWGEQGEKII